MSKIFAVYIFNMFAVVCILKVQRPVDESMLDVDLTLDALMCDSLNSSNLYTVKLNPRVAQRVHFPANINGHAFGSGSTAVDGFPPAKVNGTQHTTGKFKLSEEMVRETFSPFGTVDQVALHPKPGKHARHALISELRRFYFLSMSCCAVRVRAHAEFSVCLWMTRVQEFRGKICCPQLHQGPLEGKLPPLSIPNSAPLTFLGCLDNCNHHCGSWRGRSRRRGEDAHGHQFWGKDEEALTPAGENAAMWFCCEVSEMFRTTKPQSVSVIFSPCLLILNV